MFRWTCLALAAIVAGVALWMLDDVRREVKRTNETVATRLPEILDNVQRGTTTLAGVAQDIDAIRDLAGLANGARDRSLVVYADAVLDLVEQQSGQIGLPERLGDGLKDLVPVADWVREARREALWLTVRASSKTELLERLAKNKFGSAWQYVAPGKPPVALLDLVKSLHPESRGL